MENNFKYALISAAKNEEKYIRFTLESVTSQKIVPDIWIIVDDGSADKTYEIINEYAIRYSYIKLIKNDACDERNFRSKVFALKKAYSEIDVDKYDFIGNIDADVSFDSDYYERLISHFHENRRLGIGGGLIWEKRNGRWRCVHGDPKWYVGGATQMFRKECLAQIGFYPLLSHGGEDTVLEYLARYYEWDVKPFKTALFITTSRFHANKSLFQIYYYSGKQEYHWGSSILFQTVKCVSRLFKYPLLIGGFLEFLGYMSEFIKKEKKEINADVEKIIRSQQLKRLKILKNINSCIKIDYR